MTAAAMAPIIAIVGSDGAGKSTLAADVLRHVAKQRPAEIGYLGLGSGEQGRAIGRLPLIGPPLHRRLDRVADQLRDPSAPIPGMVAARYALHTSRKRLDRFDALLARRRAGITIITDRYPQVEVAGLHDGPILAGRATSTALKTMQTAERMLYDRMVAHVPTLVIRLTVDLDTAMARKPDHDRALIAAKIASIGKLTFNGAPLVEIDATQPYADELAQAIAAVDAALTAHA